jgi:hypothetical protein
MAAFRSSLSSTANAVYLLRRPTGAGRGAPLYRLQKVAFDPADFIARCCLGSGTPDRCVRQSKRGRDRSAAGAMRA